MKKQIDVSAKPVFTVRKNKRLSAPNFTKFDIETGDKVATEHIESDKEASNGADVKQRLSNMEAVSAARSNRSSPMDKAELAKDISVGGSLAFLGSRVTNMKNPLAAAGTTAAAAITSGVLSRNRQRGEYNKQQAAREYIAGGKTARSETYAKYLAAKYKAKAE